jgi:hypothetical protein
MFGMWAILISNGRMVSTASRGIRYSLPFRPLRQFRFKRIKG